MKRSKDALHSPSAVATTPLLVKTVASFAFRIPYGDGKIHISPAEGRADARDILPNEESTSGGARFVLILA